MGHPSRAPVRPLTLVDPPPATVWTALKTERQAQVIRLLARLACTFAATPTRFPKEPVHAHPIHHH